MVEVRYIGYEDLTVAATSVGFTAATFAAGDYATVLVQVGPVRFRLDGGAPTASVGDTLEVGDRLELNHAHELSNARFIRRDGTSATLRCHYGVQGD